MKIITHGITRIVLVFEKVVIKIPNFRYSHSHFLQGCYANWSERQYCKVFIEMDDRTLYERVAPSYYCSWFGLIQIQAKCEPLTRNLTAMEKKTFKSLCGTDNKRSNFGLYKERVVCLDYA